MKTEAQLNDWDDLVFENRNQQYGAYAIRKSYSDNLLSGALLSACFGALVLLIPFLSSLMGKDVKSPDVVVCDLGEIIFDTPPIIEVDQPVLPATPVQSTNDKLPPLVTTKPTDADIPTNAEVSQSLSSTADGIEGTVPTTAYVAVAVTEPPVVVEPAVFVHAEVMPAYDGGMEAMYKFLQKKIRYPSASRRMGLQGTVFVSFVVSATGAVTDVQIVRGISAELDKEAARVVALLPAWKAGMQHNKNVAVRMTIPIKFQLENQ